MSTDGNPFLVPEATPTNLQDQIPSHPASKAAYQDLFLRSIDSILLVSISNGDIIETNDAASQIFKLPIEKLQGLNIYHFCLPEFLAEFRKMIRIASRRYHPKIFEVPLVVGEQACQISTEMAASPLKLNDSSEVLQLIFRDVTEKKEAEKKIAQYIELLEVANKKLEELATTDGLTGLTNVRHFMNILEKEHTRVLRYPSAYTLVFCDIDHFKKYNDQNGHPEGDKLLKEFAKLLKTCVRTTDIPARYGGEEFVVLLPETELLQAKIVAERICKTISSTHFEHGHKQPLGLVSVSIGVASYPQDGKHYKDVLEIADKRLYSSKSNGRNQVTIA